MGNQKSGNNKKAKFGKTKKHIDKITAVFLLWLMN